MLEICMVFWKSEPQYAYKHYAYKKTCISTQKLLKNVYKPRAYFQNFTEYAFQKFAVEFSISPKTSVSRENLGGLAIFFLHLCS